MPANASSTFRLLAPLLALCCALCACGPQRGSPAPATDPDREQSQGALLASPPSVEERRLDTPDPVRPPIPQHAGGAPYAPVQREPGPGYIVLQPGETLSYISALYSVSEKDLVAWNGLLSPGDVRAGQRIALRPPMTRTSAPSAQDPQAVRVYTAQDRTNLAAVPSESGVVSVAPGQSLSTIAGQYGVSVAELRQWNNLQGDSIKTGQRLRIHPPPQPFSADDTLGIPSAAQPAEGRMVLRSEHNAHDDSPDSEGRISVKSGQSLSSIAAKYKVSTRDLRQWNTLKSDTLKPGQRLRVQRVHTVKTGESLGGIAAKYKVSSKELMRKNNLTDPNFVPVGKHLVIP